MVNTTLIAYLNDERRYNTCFFFLSPSMADDWKPVKGLPGWIVLCRSHDPHQTGTASTYLRLPATCHFHCVPMMRLDTLLLMLLSILPSSSLMFFQWRWRQWRWQWLITIQSIESQDETASVTDSDLWFNLTGLNFRFFILDDAYYRNDHLFYVWRHYSQTRLSLPSRNYDKKKQPVFQSSPMCHPVAWHRGRRILITKLFSCCCYFVTAFEKNRWLRKVPIERCR